MVSKSTKSDRRKLLEAVPRWYQFSLLAMIGLTAIIAGFFSLALTLGYVDAAITLMALALLLAVIRCPPQAHWVTGVFLTAVATLMLWANLRPTGWESQFDQQLPNELDAVTKTMFWRGWPVCPWMLCEWRHMAPDVEQGLPQAALPLNGAVFLAALFGAKAACKRCLRGRKVGDSGGDCRGVLVL